jgi:DUF4097 and DUF4098 domain-containing protein YvlB
LDELDALKEQLEEDIISKTKADKNRRRVIQQYVVQVMKDSIPRLIEIEALVSVPQVKVVTNVKNGQTRVVVMAEGSEPLVISIPEVPDISELPQAPKLKYKTSKHKYSHSYGNYVKTFRDSLETTDRRSKILILNPFGKMSITGWDRPLVSATYEISIASAHPGMAEKFGEQVEMNIFKKKNKIYVAAVVPNLTDIKTRIAESYLNLMVPFENELQVNTSAGEISMTGLKNDIKIKSNHTVMDLYRIEGDVEIVNSGGEIELERVAGDILVQNLMGGPVSLQSCKGTIEIQNSHGPVEVNYCKGDITIRNNGSVDIDHHSGSVKVKNRNGLVSVNNIDGNLVAYNSFEPLKVYNITGSVQLENANAVIEAEKIQGTLDINNHFGQIFTSYIAGPITIESKNGDVFMELFEEFAGESSVIANNGRIILGLSPQLNLLLTMEVKNGHIGIWDFEAVAFSDKSGTQSAKVKIGEGSNLLAIKGSNSSIIVKESD